MSSYLFVQYRATNSLPWNQLGSGNDYHYTFSNTTVIELQHSDQCVYLPPYTSWGYRGYIEFDAFHGNPLSGYKGGPQSTINCPGDATP